MQVFLALGCLFLSAYMVWIVGKMIKVDLDIMAPLYIGAECLLYFVAAVMVVLVFVWWLISSHANVWTITRKVANFGLWFACSWILFKFIRYTIKGR